MIFGLRHSYLDSKTVRSNVEVLTFLREMKFPLPNSSLFHPESNVSPVSFFSGIDSKTHAATQRKLLGNFRQI
jgi:hypothetical protein